jgi:tetratricopeptide (TPR) repeat protein
MAKKQADMILQNFDQARSYLEQTLEREAEEKIANNSRKQEEVRQKIERYNQAINSFNACLTALGLQKNNLPVIGDQELEIIPEIVNHSSNGHGEILSNEVINLV